MTTILSGKNLEDVTALLKQQAAELDRLHTLLPDAPADYVLQPGDMVSVDLCGSYRVFEATVIRRYRDLLLVRDVAGVDRWCWADECRIVLCAAANETKGEK